MIRRFFIMTLLLYSTYTFAQNPALDPANLAYALGKEGKDGNQIFGKADSTLQQWNTDRFEEFMRTLGANGKNPDYNFKARYAALKANQYYQRKILIRKNL